MEGEPHSCILVLSPLRPPDHMVAPRKNNSCDGSSSDTMCVQTESLPLCREATVPSYHSEHFPPLPYCLQLLHLLLQDSTGLGEVIAVVLALAETLAGIAEVDGEGILLLQQLRELHQGRGEVPAQTTSPEAVLGQLA